MPFVKLGVGYRLLHEPYKNILNDVKEMSNISVEDTFKSSTDAATGTKPGIFVQSTQSVYSQTACFAQLQWRRSLLF